MLVEIQDSGPGIPENELSNLFKHFVQTSTGIKKGSGTGLGLALSREIAILMGGEITATSQVGVGSLFTFHVEIKEGAKSAVEQINNQRVIGVADNRRKYRILVVDDKKENLQVVTILLKMVGFETNEAVNGEDAFAKFETWNPDLILMDLRMPIMDGYEATRRIKLTEKGAKTPIIVLTASTFEGERKKIEAMGIQGYIRKPFRESELFNNIGKVLGIKFIYENETNSTENQYLNDEEVISADLAKLPQSWTSQMLDAIEVADLDQILELIKNIEPEYQQLAQYLTKTANNYDYAHLQHIITS